MLDILIGIAAALLTCVGIIHLCTWAAIRFSVKNNRVFKIIPIGGEGKHTGDQMSLLYACMQWEANPSRQIYVLYNNGLNEEELKACEQLTRSTGALLVRTPEELYALLKA